MPLLTGVKAKGLDVSWTYAFVDVGVGVELGDGHLTGLVRTTTGTPEKSGHIASRISFADASIEGDYRTNIQIAELNARNASDAVIRRKKYRAVYADLGSEHFSVLSITTNHVLNADRSSADDSARDESGVTRESHEPAPRVH